VAEKKEEKRQAELARQRRRTFRAISEMFIEEHAKAKKRTWREDDYKLGKYVLPAIGDMLMEEITRQDIKDRMLTRIVRPIMTKQGERLVDDQDRCQVAAWKSSPPHSGGKQLGRAHGGGRSPLQIRRS
jgi:hypothetical protein